MSIESDARVDGAVCDVSDRVDDDDGDEHQDDYHDDESSVLGLQCEEQPTAGAWYTEDSLDDHESGDEVAEVGGAAATYGMALRMLGVPTAAAQWVIMIGGAAVAGALIGGSGRRARHGLDTQHVLAQQLVEADRLKTAFLRVVSHDLRTPVASLIGFTELLHSRDGQLPRDSQQEISVRLVRNARKIAQIVDDLLQLDELNTGRVTPELAPTDIAALVREVVAAADLPDIAITVDAEPIVPVDAAKIRRAVDNLLANAARYTQPGTARVTVTGDGTGGATITVEDHGPGVPDEDKAIIFEPFERGAGRHGSDIPGSGLGLSLVREFAGLHGGHAWVDDRPGGGARFHIRLPGTADEHSSDRREPPATTALPAASDVDQHNMDRSRWNESSAFAGAYRR